MATVAVVGGDPVVRTRVRAELVALTHDVEAITLDEPAQLEGLEYDGVVLLSSASVYGAHPGVDPPITEGAAPRPNAGHTTAEAALAAEQELARVVADRSDLAVAVLRPAMLVGAENHPWLVDAFVGGRLMAVSGHSPPLQFLHVDDLVSAAVHAAIEGLDGVYNVASHGWLSGQEVEAVLQRRRMEVPQEVAVGVAERLSRAGLADMDTGLVNHLMHPCVVSVERLVATGWNPVRTNRDTLAQLADTHGELVRFGPVQTTRPEVRRAAAITGGLLGALAAILVLRRSRRRQEEA